MIKGLINNSNTTANAVMEYFGRAEADVFAEYADDNQLHTFLDVIETAQRREQNRITDNKSEVISWQL